MRVLFTLAVLLILSGCSMLDNASFENAQPIRPGSVKAGSVTYSALDVHNLLDLESRYKNHTEVSKAPQGLFNMGVRTSVGVTPYLEAIAVGSLGENLKLSLKYCLPQSRKNLYIAVLPTYLIHRGEYSSDQLHEYSEDKETYSCKGIELPILITQKTSDYTSHTFAFKAGYYPVDYDYKYTTYSEGHAVYNRQKGRSDVYSVGLGVNMHIDFKYFYMTPMMGVDYITAVDGRQGVLFNGGLGMGFQMYLLPPPK